MNSNLYLTENSKNIVGDVSSLLKYISLTKRQGKKSKEVFIDENFYPKKKVSTDRKILIDNILEYIEELITEYENLFEMLDDFFYNNIYCIIIWEIL